MNLPVREMHKLVWWVEDPKEAQDVIGFSGLPGENIVASSDSSFFSLTNVGELVTLTIMVFSWDGNYYPC